jgi:gamma-glutamylcyclotransferase (GGCT)/AIG2-like uncharacterized protein YtfP
VQYLFVYGLLRQGSVHPIADWLNRCAVYEGPASIQGRLYRIHAYPGAVMSSRRTDHITGSVYRLIRPTQTLAKLDNFEGCGKQSSQPFEFRRTTVNVLLDNGRKLRAWAYVYNLPVRGLPKISSGDFMRP